MTPTLTILIPTLKEREVLFDRLISALAPQCEPYGVQAINFKDNREHSIGYKRNQLVASLSTDYGVFFDDDDLPADTYVSDIMEALQADPDCVTFRGLMKPERSPEEEFIFRLGSEYYQEKLPNGRNYYYRPPSHLCPMRSSIMKQFTYPDISHGEDSTVCLEMHASGIIKSEVFIDKVLYHYLYRNKK